MPEVHYMNRLWKMEIGEVERRRICAPFASDAGLYLSYLDLNFQDILVDFGCGSGEFLSSAAEKVGFAIGIDKDPHEILITRSKIMGRRNASAIQGDFLELDLSDQYFTKAYARRSLHYLNNEEKCEFFEKISPSLDEEALFLIEDYILEFDSFYIPEKMHEILLEAEGYYGCFWDAIREDFLHCLKYEQLDGIESWREALRRGGFEIVKNWQLTGFYGVILAKKTLL